MVAGPYLGSGALLQDHLLLELHKGLVDHDLAVILPKGSLDTQLA